MRDRADIEPHDSEASYEDALANPAAYYESPMAIAADDSLGRDQKLGFLREWAQDLVDVQAADGEGMAPDCGEVQADAGALLKQVQAALADVEASEAAPPAGPLRSLWRRLTR